jgi:hypothetical protein
VNRLFSIAVLLGLLPFLLAANVASIGDTRIIFLHHSCGQNLINEGGVREGLTALGYEFYDHGYNDEGLRLADGSYTGTNFDIPGDNTDPDGFAEIFGQPLHDPPDNAFSHLMQYDVIAFKSCYPTSNIYSDEHLAEYKSYYLSIRDRMDQYPNKIFVIVTPPPQVPGASDAEEATRARAFVNWLGSDEYLAGHPNVFTFDFFDYLAGSDNFLRPEYRYDDYDAHPNERANREIGPSFVSLIDQAIRSYDTGAAPLPPVAPPPEGGEEQPPPVIMPISANTVDDFEIVIGEWEPYSEDGSTVQCGPETGMAHNGTGALHIGYSIESHGWGDCGRHFDGPQDWSGNTGLSFWLRSEGSGEWVTLMVFSGDPDGPTPFEVSFETTAETDGGWAQFAFLWTDLERAEWADETGLAQIDPSRITGYGFTVGADEERNESNLWIDDVTTITGEEQPQPEPVVAPPEEPDEEPVEEPGDEPIGEPEEESGGGFCPGAVALPLGAAGILLTSRRRRTL